MVEVPFEYKGSRRALCFEVSTVCDRVEQELRDLGVTEPNVNQLVWLRVTTIALSPGMVQQMGGFY